MLGTRPAQPVRGAMRRKKWIALAVLPVLLLIGGALTWRVAVEDLRARLEAWIVRAHEAGWDIVHGPIAVGGWPDSAVLRVENVAISGRGGIAWSGGALLLRMRLLNPTVLELTPVESGPLRLRSYPPIPISADHLRLRLLLTANGPPRAVSMEAVSLSATLPKLGSIASGHVLLDAALTLGAGREEPAVTFSASARSVLLPDRLRFGLGPEIDDLSVEGVVNGPIPPPQRGLAERAGAWRDGGGSVELHKLGLSWGPARLDATATLALDEDLQPMGAGTGKIAGFGAALDALAAHAVLGRSAAIAAKAVLSLLADAPAAGEPDAVEVPMTLQFRTLSVRQVPLGRLPELTWPSD